MSLHPHLNEETHGICCGTTAPNEVFSDFVFPKQVIEFPGTYLILYLEPCCSCSRHVYSNTWHLCPPRNDVSLRHTVVGVTQPRTSIAELSSQGITQVTQIKRLKTVRRLKYLVQGSTRYVSSILGVNNLSLRFFRFKEITAKHLC